MSRISTNTEHTPGPWNVQPYQADQGESIAICAGSHIIALIPPEEEAREGEWSKEDKSNARLIAAAPEMLEALAEILRNVSPWERADTMAGRLGGIARAAIAKAEGRTL